jgi:hypothetical protein
LDEGIWANKRKFARGPNFLFNQHLNFVACLAGLPVKSFGTAACQQKIFALTNLSLTKT